MSAACHRSNFSSNQWAKAPSRSRCYRCVDGNDESENLTTARRNESANATFTTYDLNNPFAEGAFRWVARGRYTVGMRNGQECVCKWFKTGHVFDNDFYSLDIQAMNKALEIVEKWNNLKLIDRLIKVNIPEVWVFQQGSQWAGRKVLQEPFIDNYEKFNSNSGWAVDSFPWAQVMQALSHFSYHSTGGQYVLCDLQGGVYGDGVVLTDPVILSRRKEYGVTDLGPTGISSFFSNHRCNKYCRSNWSMPADRQRYHSLRMGTSMISGHQNVPYRNSRQAMSGAYGC